MGGNLREYANLYGGTARYNPDGSLTQAGQQAGVQAVPNPSEQRRDPTTGNLIVPGTDVHLGEGGAPLKPPLDTSTDQGLVDAQDAYGQIDMTRQGFANRLNQDTTFGSRTHTIDPETGRATVTDRLDPWGERRYEQQQGTSFKAGEQIGSQIGAFGAQGAFGYEGNVDPTLGQGDLLGERQRVEGLVSDSFERRNAPRFEQEQQELQQSLADRGIDTNNARAQYEMQQLKQRQEDARLNSQARASELGRSEFETSFGASEDVRNRQTGEYRDEYGAPLSAASSLQGLQTPMQLPQFKQISDIDTNFANPAGIGTTTRGQDTAYNTAVDVANIQEQGALKRKKIGAESEAAAREQAADRAGITGSSGTAIENPYDKSGGPKQPEHGSLEWQVQEGLITPEMARAENDRLYQANNPYQQNLGQPKPPPAAAAKGGFQ